MTQFSEGSLPLITYLIIKQARALVKGVHIYEDHLTSYAYLMEKKLIFHIIRGSRNSPTVLSELLFHGNRK
ncbi:predicted protein [Sclerotinia sclerotiorum 1980 UF-70]|uniref:Uncharacterized protein n=1 Tax=Sclerotinia sclerotiorum (strain ATCC 18683 / 1980 / Ss-1) TaxID=665079 RepID=A7EZ43_SCLS1|nr:predicted protein [Sclerotinia sclerotiorum 1980 UF-70]EDN94735.1 predicted protein [Sclerotinia sclerotiorum 1980 UF-70]